MVQECKADGSGYEDKDCRTLDAFATADAKCLNDACVDPCGAAARSGSSEGCDFWAAATTNVQLDAMFKGGAADGAQGDAVSDFALVFANPNAVAANVKVLRMKGGVEQVSPSTPAADASGLISVPAGGSRTVYLPWQAVAATGVLPYAFHVLSSVPVAAYQFNPLDAYTGSAKQLDPTTGECTNCSYTADASMLVPARSLTGTYVVAGLEHQSITAAQGGACSTDDDCPGDGNYCLFINCAFGATYQVPAFFSVVAAENGTKVTIRFAADTAAAKSGTAIAAQAAGSTASYTLNRYDVLQFWTVAGTGPTQCSSYASGSSWKEVCRHPLSDLTGTVVTAVDVADSTKPKPVGVFSGADCSFVPYEQFACDHLEEMALPVSAWGKAYVGAHSPPYCKNTNAGACSAPVAAPAPDHWRVIAGCARENCPNGTRVVVDPAPAAAQVCGAMTYVLPPVDVPGGKPLASFLEFAHEGNFLLTADQPVELAQYLTGESANAGAVEGDPSLVMTAPIEQWRNVYDLLAPPTLVHNHLTLVAPVGIASLLVDGKAVTAASFPGLVTSKVGAAYNVHQVPVAGGPHSVAASDPVGATVTGYDSFISIGYLGGANLKAINASMP